ncbi:hypothetical protein ACHQM5_020054 [Ranunculus cassubicifolius]
MAVAPPVCPWGFLGRLGETPRADSHIGNHQNSAAIGGWNQSRQGSTFLERLKQGQPQHIDVDLLPDPVLEDGTTTITLPKAIVDRGKKFCEFALVGRLDFKKTSLDRTKTLIIQNLAPKGEWNFTPLGKGFFMLRLHNRDEFVRIWAQNWNFGKQMVRFSQWSPDFDPEAQKTSSTPLWVKFPKLKQHYWDYEALMRIGKGLGKPIGVDERTIKRDFGYFAYILIEIDLSKPIPSNITIKEEDGSSFVQEVEIPKMPQICSHCNGIGHSMFQCRGLIRAINPEQNRQNNQAGNARVAPRQQRIGPQHRGPQPLQPDRQNQRAAGQDGQWQVVRRGNRQNNTVPENANVNMQKENNQDEEATGPTWYDAEAGEAVDLADDSSGEEVVEPVIEPHDPVIDNAQQQGVENFAAGDGTIDEDSIEQSVETPIHADGIEHLPNRLEALNDLEGYQDDQLNTEEIIEVTDDTIPPEDPEIPPGFSMAQGDLDPLTTPLDELAALVRSDNTAKKAKAQQEADLVAARFKEKQRLLQLEKESAAPDVAGKKGKDKNKAKEMAKEASIAKKGGQVGAGSTRSTRQNTKALEKKRQSTELRS